MGRKPKVSNQRTDRLKDRIDKLTRDNTKDLQEMEERGKEIVKIARIVRECRDLMAEEVNDQLMVIIEGFETRCK